jgi:hypothetical protein
MAENRLYLGVVVDKVALFKVFLCVFLVSINSFADPIGRGSKAWVYCGSPAEIVLLNPTGSMDVCLLSVLIIVRYNSLTRTDHSSRGVLPTVVRRRV